MVVGVLTIELLLVESNSLKDKRHVIRSLLDTVRKRFNVCAAELDGLDSRQRAVLGFACISNDQRVANGILSRILGFVESEPRAAVEGSSIEFL